MADEYQIQYEYSAGNTIDFKTNNLNVTYHRKNMRVDTAVDGTRIVTDPGNTWREFQFTARITGNAMDTLDSVQMAAIDYTDAYPRIQKIYWDGDSTESNIEVAIPDGGIVATDMGNYWEVTITMLEKDQ